MAERVHRVNVNFSEGAYSALERLAHERGKSMSDVLRDAITLELWVHEAERRGERVMIERNGSVREVVLR